jgi:catechol 2,3-dioxygenase-like lactoylglutathione lyase family enzyme
MPHRAVLVAVVALMMLRGAEPEPAAQRREGLPAVRQIDHIMIKADDPREVFAFFTETLRLPVAWALETRGGITSGGVGFGNVNVEAIRFPGQPSLPSRAQLVGFGFEPFSMQASLEELQRRGVPYGALRPLVSTGPDGTKQMLFTNVTLRALSDTELPGNAQIHIFLSEYSPTYVDVEARRSRVRKELTETYGGPLGVEEVLETVIGATDVAQTRAQWQKLLDPEAPTASGAWQVGAGPAIRIVRANEDRLKELVVRIRSIGRAKAFLRDGGLLASESATEARLDPSKVFGLGIRLVE